MAIPDFQTIMLPLMRDLAQGERTSQETADALAIHFGLTADEVAARIPSGLAPRFANRIAWAKTHLKMAGVIESPRRAVYQLSARGRELLASSPTFVTMALLSQYPEYVAFRRRRKDSVAEPAIDESNGFDQASKDARTPDELIQEGYDQLRTALAQELRRKVIAMTPAHFEQLVIDLLKAMGYGGPQEDAGIVVGRGGDEGIDGVIREDRLGLETIYLQAKRWENKVVGRPEIQRFAGALQGQRARKGVFITASTFSSEARAYAASIQTMIVLIDGAQLAEFMIDHDVGVNTAKRLDIKRIDSDYFETE
jgi:restriction system protein